ncbi:MAG TPA: hypothetical protein HPQ03_17820 [Deltaproteobacteria bacterium]|nr:hypothetical protein [Deltaproteobacteria bacterium]
MKKSEIEIRVMKYFTENMNLLKHLDIAKECANSVFDLKFNDIITDKFEMPSDDEMRKMVGERVPHEFDAKSFVEKGPLDFSGFDDQDVEELLKKVEDICNSLHEAQTVAVAKATISALKKLEKNVKNEIKKIRKKYLS